MTAVDSERIAAVNHSFLLRRLGSLLRDHLRPWIRVVVVVVDAGSWVKDQRTGRLLSNRTIDREETTDLNDSATSGQLVRGAFALVISLLHFGLD